MTKTRRKSRQTDGLPDIGELPHRPHYEIRTASQSYSNIAAVLSGFALAAVVLVVQSVPPSTSPNANTFQDWATIAFLLSFIGCIISALTFAVVTGEEILAPRSHSMALLGGIGFSISTNLVIFGLAMLIKIYLSLTIDRFVDLAFPMMMSLSPLFVAFSALDPIIGFDHDSLTSKDVAQVFIPSFAPLVIILIIRYSGGAFTTAITASVINLVMGAAIMAILLSAISVMVVSSFKSIRFRLSLLATGVIVGIHSLIIGLLILML